MYLPPQGGRAKLFVGDRSISSSAALHKNMSVPLATSKNDELSKEVLASIIYPSWQVIEQFFSPFSSELHKIVACAG